MSDNNLKKTDKTVTVGDLKKIIEEAGGGECPICKGNSFDFIIDGNRELEGQFLMPFVTKERYFSEDTMNLGVYFRMVCNNCTYDMRFNALTIINKLNNKNG
ncbi:MAG: hypothetical protein ACL7AY_09000 [Candidatus Arsenophonus phytopathogenicus]